MREIFERYKGEVISINCTDPVKIENLELFLVNDTYFGVLNSETGFRAYYNYENVVGVFETDENPLYVNVRHFVLYKGGTGFGLGVGVRFPI